MSDMNPQDEANSPHGTPADSADSAFGFPPAGNGPEAVRNVPSEQDASLPAPDDGPYHGISFDDAMLGTMQVQGEQAQGDAAANGVDFSSAQPGEQFDGQPDEQFGGQFGGQPDGAQTGDVQPGDGQSQGAAQPQGIAQPMGEQPTDAQPAAASSPFPTTGQQAAVPDYSFPSAPVNASDEADSNEVNPDEADEAGTADSNSADSYPVGSSPNEANPSDASSGASRLGDAYSDDTYSQDAYPIDATANPSDSQPFQPYAGANDFTALSDAINNPAETVSQSPADTAADPASAGSADADADTEAEAGASADADAATNADADPDSADDDGRLGEASAWISAHLHTKDTHAKDAHAKDSEQVDSSKSAYAKERAKREDAHGDSADPSDSADSNGSTDESHDSRGHGTHGGAFGMFGLGKESAEDSEKESDKHDRKARAESKRVAIMRGIITPIFGTIAVIALIFGVLNSTLWRPQHDVAASTQQVSTQYLATIPGVLQLVDDTVSVDVKAQDPNAELCMEVSNQNDVASWLDGVTYTQVSAMASWSSLQTQQAKTGDVDTTEGADSLSFKDADLWTQATCGTGEISADSLTYNPQDALIVVSDPENPGMSDSTASPYTLTLSWHRDSVPNYAMPFYAVALLFALLAALAATVFSREREGKRVAGEDEVPLWEQTAVMARLRHKSFTSHRGDAQPEGDGDQASQTVSSVDVDDGKGVEIKDELGETTASYSVQDFRDYFNQLQNENPDLSASSVLDDVVATTGSMPAITDAKFRPEPKHAQTPEAAEATDTEATAVTAEMPNAAETSGDAETSAAAQTEETADDAAVSDEASDAASDVAEGSGDSGNPDDSEGPQTATDNDALDDADNHDATDHESDDQEGAQL
ncbi:MAG: hypothetical protein PUF51_02130 [Bifidobacteriaceae bacterium]|nr:hypothetical protein [Bifidobacteriaceae bacterium]